MKLTYDITEADFAEYVHWLQSRKAATVKRHPASYTLWIGMCVGIGLFAVRDSDAVHFTALGFLLGGIFVYAIWHWYSKAAQVIYKPSKSSHLLGPHTSEIQDIGIKITSGCHDATYFWSTISGTEITENYVFIPLDRLSSIMIPKRAFASQEQTKEFLAEVRTRAKRIEPY